ncbi:hypothetical protein [Hymenobacter psychrophilus]|nr:hypothetical protein [Hymenobacter psychrophilus]
MLKPPGLLLLTLSLLALAGCSQAQETKEYKPSAVIQQEARSGKPGANQFAAWDLSYIGEYQAALEAWEAPYGAARPVRYASAPDSAAFVALQPVAARDYILRRARTEQLVILNEAHHNPRHRAFAAELLPELARLGYRYFAVEALNEQDTLLNQRGYPTRATGYYTKEPQFAHLLRTAARSGFKLVAYDHGFSHEGDLNAQVQTREMAEARNIQRILQADPKAKILVYCGFAHASEGLMGMGTQPAMAHYLQAYTGINPLTIDQTTLTEAGTPGGEYARYHLVKAAQSAVFLDAQGQPFGGADSNKSVDVSVYHPRTTYQSGRPNWTFTNDRQPVLLKEPLTVGYPCLVLAYDTREDLATAVPVDVVELQGPADRKALALGKGRYTLVAKGPAGRTQTWSLQR